METMPPVSNPDENADLVQAFHLMWDGFPSPAALLRKDRTVLACNPPALKIGYKVGARCFQTFGEKAVHKHCHANEALKGEPQRHIVYYPGPNAVCDSYWLPVPGVDGVFVHTVINISEYAKPELFQEQQLP